MAANSKAKAIIEPKTQACFSKTNQLPKAANPIIMTSLMMILR